jgi:GNAT superfamily N-acetyltransferase
MIRAATAQDVPVIARFIRELAEYERLSDHVRFTEAELKKNLFGRRRYAEVLLAHERGRPVGFALFFSTFSTFLGRSGLYLEDLFVEPAARGRGHGKALLAALSRLCVERSGARLEWSVLDWNAPAIAFYRSLGAELMTSWRTFRLTGAALTALSEPAQSPRTSGRPPRSSTARPRRRASLSARPRGSPRKPAR